MKRAILLPLALCLWLCAMAANAAIEELDFDSPEQEARYHFLIDEMRCPMCLNANLSGSDAPIAADLRAEIHSQILEGKSNAEIIAFMKARYGDFILYRPPLNPATTLLWFGPLVLLALGLFVARRLLRQQRFQPAAPDLSLEEQARLQSLLNDEDSPAS
ncbi:MAG TPA: cytochrome c-type biogenesis protein [Hyphomicrobiales bacterium]|nr:cytochrome c-type biogenesis protein [Hyphomicrobiales bacterium]